MFEDIFGPFFDRWMPDIYEHEEAATEFAIALDKFWQRMRETTR